MSASLEFCRKARDRPASLSLSLPGGTIPSNPEPLAARNQYCSTGDRIQQRHQCILYHGLPRFLGVSPRILSMSSNLGTGKRAQHDLGLVRGVPCGFLGP